MEVLARFAGEHVMKQLRRRKKYFLYTYTSTFAFSVRNAITPFLTVRTIKHVSHDVTVKIFI